MARPLLAADGVALSHHGWSGEGAEMRALQEQLRSGDATAEPTWLLRHATMDDVWVRLRCGCMLTKSGQPYILDVSSGEAMCPYDYFQEEA